jgi:predicted house-cleaning noncanonical NTP pyrophosphatase (MazG superfamily)
MLTDPKKIYEEINNYCDFTDTLNKKLEESDIVHAQDKSKILFPLIDELRDMGNKLVEQYVAYLKDKKNRELADVLKNTLQEILIKIDYCKNKVYELYKNKENNSTKKGKYNE